MKANKYEHIRDAVTNSPAKLEELITEPDVVFPFRMRRTYFLSEEEPPIKIERKIALSPYEAEIVWETSVTMKKEPSFDDIVDEIIYWDEDKNVLYVEAIAYFENTKEFVRFRKDITTKLSIIKHSCPICDCRDWLVKEVDAKTVVTTDGKRWKCFSLIFVCRKCESEGKVSMAKVSMIGFKYAFVKFSKGVKDFFERLNKVVISADLSNQKAEAELDIEGRGIEKLTRCPLLG